MASVDIMTAIYAAIADKAIPMIQGFGNDYDKNGLAFERRIREEYPVLNEYMNGARDTSDAFIRYLAVKNSSQKVVDMSTGEVYYN